MLKTSGAVVAAREEWRRRARRGRRSCIVLSVTEEPDNNGNSSNSCSPGAWQNSRTWQLRMYDEAPACFLSSLPFIQIRKTFMQSAPSAMNAIHVHILQCMQHIFCDICNIYFAIYAQYILHYMQYIFCIICNIYFAINKYTYFAMFAKYILPVPLQSRAGTWADKGIQVWGVREMSKINCLLTPTDNITCVQVASKLGEMN